MYSNEATAFRMEIAERARLTLHEFHELKDAGIFDPDNLTTIPDESVAAQLRL
jgi:hypothetical protein